MSKHHETAPFIERLIFNNRMIVLLIFALITALLGYQAAQVKPDTSFEKMIPLKHPYIVNMIEHQNDLANLGNSIRIAVAIEDGDIFSSEYMETLKRVNDEVFFLPGVDRSNLRSLWTPNVRWTEVTEYGFDGGPVANRPAYLNEDDLEELRENVLKSLKCRCRSSIPIRKIRASSCVWITVISPASWKKRFVLNSRVKTPISAFTSLVLRRRSGT